MLHVAIGHAEGIRTDSVVAQVLTQCEAQLAGVRPRLGILYASGDFVHQRILDAVHERFPSLGHNLIGCTTRGDMSSLCGFSEDSVTLMLLSSDVVSLSVGLGRNCSQDPARAIREALEQARAGLQGPERLCVAWLDITRGEGGDVVMALDRALDPSCALFGGAVARPWGLQMMPIGQFFGREVLSDALPILLMGGPIEYSYSIENGWRPVGERQRVMSARGRVVGRIGDMSALDFHYHYLGRHSFGKNSRPLSEFPLAVFENETDDYYYLRVPDSYDTETGQVTYVDKVPEGAMVRLTEAIRPYMHEQIQTCAKRLGHEVVETSPLFGLAFSCSARRPTLGSQVGREADALRTYLKNVPLIGFYGFGEIAPNDKGRSSFLHHATLITLVVHGGKHPTAAKPVWQPPAEINRSADDPRDTSFLRRRLSRSEYFRTMLERRHDQSSTLLHTIHGEIERSRQRIVEQNEELIRLNVELAQEKRKAEELLLNILPRDVAEELKRTGHVEPVYYDSVTVLFTDFKGFTRIASTMSPKRLLDELDYYFSAFDTIIERHGLEKLKTIGDAYMCAGGLPTPFGGHALAVAQAAWEMQQFMIRDQTARKAAGRTSWALRIGINSGPLMAGVIGKKKFAYDIWGDTVNIASRLESNGEADRINISRSTYEAIQGHFDCEYRGKIPVKNAGEIDMYFVVRPKASAG
jgi:class 3 adenylate cyclase